MPAPRAASCLVVLLGLLASIEVGAEAPVRWQGSEGPLPFATVDEVIDYLQRAEVVARKELSSGTTKPWKLTLERDGVRAHAIFRTVQARVGRDWHEVEDHNRYEVAAFEVARLLGLGTVPPTTMRKIDGQRGSIQLWVENARSETERIAAGISHGDRTGVDLQKQRMRIFDALIYNFDRNTGNLLFDTTGRLWLVDHTRSFKAEGSLPPELDLDRCERVLWYALRDLDPKQLRKAVRSYLDPLQSAALLERLEALRTHLSERIGALGEDAVLYDLPPGS